MGLRRHLRNQSVRTINNRSRLHATRQFAIRNSVARIMKRPPKRRITVDEDEVHMLRTLRLSRQLLRTVNRLTFARHRRILPRVRTGINFLRIANRNRTVRLSHCQQILGHSYVRLRIIRMTFNLRILTINVNLNLRNRTQRARNQILIRLNLRNHRLRVAIGQTIMARNSLTFRQNLVLNNNGPFFTG